MSITPWDRFRITAIPKYRRMYKRDTEEHEASMRDVARVRGHLEGASVPEANAVVAEAAAVQGLARQLHLAADKMTMAAHDIAAKLRRAAAARRGNSATSLASS